MNFDTIRCPRVLNHSSTPLLGFKYSILEENSQNNKNKSDFELFFGYLRLNHCLFKKKGKVNLSIFTN